jgi:membrane-associated HD superfamily phosphohydrolase
MKLGMSKFIHFIIWFSTPTIIFLIQGYLSEKNKYRIKFFDDQISTLLLIIFVFLWGIFFLYKIRKKNQTKIKKIFTLILIFFITVTLMAFSFGIAAITLILNYGM